MVQSKEITFRIMDRAKTGSINWITRAFNENANDSYEVRIGKRKAEAEKKRDRWANTYFRDADRDADIVVVACDAQGNPL